MVGAQKSHARYWDPPVKIRAWGSPSKQQTCVMNPPAYAQPNGEKQQSRKPLQSGFVSKISRGLQGRNVPPMGNQVPPPWAEEPPSRCSRAESHSQCFSSRSSLTRIFRWITIRHVFFSWQSWAFLFLCRVLIYSSVAHTRVICACDTMTEGRLSTALNTRKRGCLTLTLLWGSNFLPVKGK